MLKIAITGGPGGGKSTIMSHAELELTNRGYKVFIIPETATEIIPNGIVPNESIPTYDFQKIVLEKQLSKEAIYDFAASFYDPQKVVILCDRGIMDQLSYIDEESFKKLLKDVDLNMAKATERYDGVIHMVTAAKGTDCYTTENNQARKNSVQDAIYLDTKTMNNWIGHSHLRVIDSCQDFDKKIKNALSEIFSLLGDPVPTEIERKFLIQRLTEEELNKIEFTSKSQILQIYLEEIDGIERRIRQRTDINGNHIFTYTTKYDMGPGKRMEDERKINAEEYATLLQEAIPSLHILNKKRYCFVYEKQYFEMDIYPFEQKYAILEIELKTIEQEITLPPFLKIIKEVTDQKEYKNRSLAQTGKLPLLL